MSSQSGKIALILALLLLILGGIVYFSLPVFINNDYIKQMPVYSPVPLSSSYGVSNSTTEMKDYYSKTLRINIKVPKAAIIEEKNTITLINLPNGLISLVRTGTNYENAKDYYNDLKQKNSLSPLSYREGEINEYDYVITTDVESDNESKTNKTYFVYSENRVFAFSSSDESLYPVLDQIVESFEYKP